MRDIELIHIADTGAIPPEVVDNAYVAASPGGVLDDTTLTDPSFADTKEYTKPSLGGEFGPGRSLLLGGPADGGEALLAAAAVVTVTAPVVPTPPIVWPGRAANNTSFLNLFPWHKVPPEGLDQNNPNPPASTLSAPLPTGVTVSGNTLVGNTGSAQFSGPASRDATVTLNFRIGTDPPQMLTFGILAGDTGTQIAAKVRNGIDAFVGLDATGTGGTVNVIGIGGDLTEFNLSVS